MSVATSTHSGSTRFGAAAGLVGFLFVTEIASGFLQGWFSPVLASIAKKYQVGSADLNWVSTSFLLSTAVLVPLIAKMGDRYGHRRMLSVSAALVTIGSLIVAFAPTYGIFILGRVISGALVAFLPLEFAILRERAGERSGAAIGLLVGGLTVGGSAGLVISGKLASHMSLTALLLIPAVLMGAAFVVVTLFVPETTTRSTGRLDWIGAGLLGAGLAIGLYGVSIGNTHGWTSGRVLGCLIGGVALLAAWVVLEQRVAHPLIDFSVLRGRGGIGLPVVIAAFFGAELFGSQTPIAIFMGTPSALGFGLGLKPDEIGYVLFVFGMAALVGTVVGPRLTERTGEIAAVVVGGVVAAAGMFLLTASHTSTSEVIVWLAICGIGNGILIAALPNMVVRRAAKDSVGIASGVYNTARTVAGAVAGAAFTAVMSGHVIAIAPGVELTNETGYKIVWATCGVLALVVAALALFTRSPATQTVSSAAPAPVVGGAAPADA